MADFNPERYLRLLGERTVVGPNRSAASWRRDKTLLEAAAALVSCGLLASETAQPLVETYTQALALAHGPGPGVRSFRIQPPAATTRAVVALERPRVPVPVRVEARAPAQLGIAYLWQLLDDFNGGFSGAAAVPPALDALQAAGLIARDDDALEAIAWVRNRAAPANGVRTLRGRPIPEAAAPPPALPEQWRSLSGGRVGTFTGRVLRVAPRAATPAFDGISLAVDTLISEAHSLSLEVEISGAVLAEPGVAVLARNPISVWVHDDRDNFYLGHTNGWSAWAHTGDGVRGSLEFAALDPAATQLTVIVATVRARALIEVAL